MVHYAGFYIYKKFWKNKPEKVFGLQVRCKELDIFKVSEIFWEIFWNFFGLFADF